jgi:NADPH:quinone reductase and related Zn-dependent oxidoreductases
MLRAGSLADLKPLDFDPEPLAPTEVRVAVRAIGLNFADVFAIWGLYGATPKGSFTPGLEYAGVVEEVGMEVALLRPGDRVMGVTRFGAYTTHLNIDARYAIPMPADWDFETGAAYLVQTLTAYYGMTTLGGLRKWAQRAHSQCCGWCWAASAESRQSLWMLCYRHRGKPRKSGLCPLRRL